MIQALALALELLTPLSVLLATLLCKRKESFYFFMVIKVIYTHGEKSLIKHLRKQKPTIIPTPEEMTVNSSM